MMNSCTFIGHRECLQDIRAVLYETIETLITEENIRTFYVGTHGQFDRIVYSVLSDIECKHDINVVVVLAYLNSKANVYYDLEKTEYPSELDGVPMKYAIRKRNEYMLRRSRFLVCYLNNPYTNTYKFVETAKRLGMEIINLGTLRI